jgi:hypothetical protein
VVYRELEKWWSVPELLSEVERLAGSESYEREVRPLLTYLQGLNEWNLQKCSINVKKFMRYEVREGSILGYVVKM